MRKLLWITSVAVAVALSMPQAWAQGDKPSKKPSAKVSLKRMKFLTVPEGKLPCKGPTGSNNFIKCTDIPVIVLLKSDGGCIVQVPYHELVVHSKKKETKVTWNLIGSDNYAFATDGIVISNPGTTFKRETPNSPRQFSWSVIIDAPAASSNHVANVIDSTNGRACEPGDPTITNEPT